MTILIPTKLLEDVSDREFDIGQRVRGTTLAKFADAANQQCFRESLWSYNISFLRDYDRTELAEGAGDPSMNFTSVTNVGGTATINENGLPGIAQNHKIALPSKSEAAESIGFILTYIAPGSLYASYIVGGQALIAAATANASYIKLRLNKRTNASTFTVVDPPSSSSESWAVEINAADSTLPSNGVLNETDVYVNVVNGNSISREINHNARGRSFRVLRTAGTVDLGDSDSTIPRRMHYNQSAGASGHFSIEIEYYAAMPIELFVFEVPKIAT